jgi:hypothetical protein
VALLKNPLNEFATHNYSWALSALYPGEVNNPDEYIGTIGKLLVARGGGVGNTKGTTTEAEEQVDSNVEFFIDDVRISTTVTPNEAATLSNFATMEFKVTEPYSLGLFLQTLALAASKAGYSNYTRAPFLMSVSFKGFKDDGTYEEVSRKNFVIQIATVTFTADGSGCVYDMKATYWSQQGLSSAYQALKHDISISGDTVGEVLGFGENSLATALNRQEILQESNNFKIVRDEFQITFPFDISPDAEINGGNGLFGGALRSIQRSLDRVNNTIEAIGSVGTSLGNFGGVLSDIGKVGIGNGLNRKNFTTPGVGVNSTLETIGNAITDLATSISTSGVNQISNEIGSSPIVDSFNESGDVPFADENLTFENGIYSRGGMSIDPSTRTFHFPIGTTIEQIVETVVLTSKWGQQFLTRPVDQTGMRPWFRIKPNLYILSLAEMSAAGRPAYRFIYQVYPYYIHQSTVALPSANNDVRYLIDDTVKAYDYIYTGKNRDIINFEMEFHTSYFMGAATDANQSTPEEWRSLGGTAFAEPDRPAVATPTSGRSELLQTLGTLRSTIERVTSLYKSAGGTFIDNDRTRIAQTFRNLILNNQADLNRVDLTIWGDPYYINNSESGNYAALPLSPNINADLEADYLRGEVHILLKFSTPADWNNDILLPDPADQFTGVYKVHTIEHVFSSGKFTQTLTTNRVPNQKPSDIDKLKRVVDAFFNALGSLSKFASVVGADDVSSGIDNFMQELGPTADQFLGLAQIGSNIQDIVTGNYQTVGDKITGIESFFSEVQQLETQYRSTIQSLGNIDFNSATLPQNRRINPGSNTPPPTNRNGTGPS